MNKGPIASNVHFITICLNLCKCCNMFTFIRIWFNRSFFFYKSSNGNTAFHGVKLTQLPMSAARTVLSWYFSIAMPNRSLISSGDCFRVTWQLEIKYAQICPIIWRAAKLITIIITIRNQAYRNDCQHVLRILDGMRGTRNKSLIYKIHNCQEKWVTRLQQGNNALKAYHNS